MYNVFMKEILAVRHGESAANKNAFKVALGANDAPLTHAGEEQAKRLGDFFEKAGISDTTPVAVSSMLRAQETARLAGFQNLVEYPELDEIAMANFSPREMMKLIGKFREMGATLLDNPPAQKIWFTHFITIESVFLATHQRFLYPHHGSVTEVELPENADEKVTKPAARLFPPSTPGKRRAAKS